MCVNSNNIQFNIHVSVFTPSFFIFPPSRFSSETFFIFLVYSCCHHRLRSSSCYNCRLSCQINVGSWTLFAFNESPSININRSQSLVDKRDLHSAKPFHALLSNETIARALSLRKLACQFGNWIDNDLHCHTIQFIADTNWNRNKWRTQIIISKIRSRWIAMHFQCVLDGMTTTKRKEILWLGIAYFGTCFDFCIERWMGNDNKTLLQQDIFNVKWKLNEVLRVLWQARGGEPWRCRWNHVDKSTHYIRYSVDYARVSFSSLT